ncbi:NEL-type E3 ubiquitin ligase domain-containing protein [Pseudomonas spelaei]
MPDLQIPARLCTPLRTADGDTPHPGPHHALIQQHIPAWLSSATPHRVQALSAVTPVLPAWYLDASQVRHQALKADNAESWRRQNTLDRQLSTLKDVYAFALPLLKRAIKDTYSLDLNVQTTFLRLYLPRQLPWYSKDFSNGVTTRTLSLLDAALHNVGTGERFVTPSCYISQPDARGHFEVLELHRRMSIEQFKQLCRELDLGKRYQQHLTQHLLADDLNARYALKQQVIASQKAALKAAAQLAVMKTDASGTPDLSQAAHHMLLRALRGEAGLMQFYQLSILDAVLTGVLLIAADLEQTASVSRLIAYLPHDPESPLKEYASSLDFMRDLTRKLRANAELPSSARMPRPTYRQFFSQFVNHAQRGYFFAGLEQRLCKVQWHARQPLDPRPGWRDTPVEQPRLQFEARKISGDTWEHGYQRALDKILNDARHIAVPTADADSQARQAWWDNVTRMLADIFNAALMVAAPFLPLVGELMLAYTAYQVTDDLFEGIVDLSQGQVAEATRHVVAVLTDMVQLGAQAVGGELAQQLLYPRSAFVDGLRAVRVNGEPRLWNPDITPYSLAQNALPVDSQPNALGLHAHPDGQVLPMANRLYRIDHNQASDTHRITHPTRADAYSPRLEHNGEGVWVHEGENPRTWDGATLRSRLGHNTDGLSVEQVRQACEISGTDDGALRKLFTRLEPLPPLLADSLQRLQLMREVQALPGRLRRGEPMGASYDWSAQLASELHGWPVGKAIQVFDNSTLSGDHRVYGSNAAGAADRLKLSRQGLAEGALAPGLVDFLDDAELQAMLPAPLPSLRGERIAALREQIAESLEPQLPELFAQLYSTTQQPPSAHGQRLREHFPQLPRPLVERLVRRALPEERARLDAQASVPLRLSNLARALQQETRASHAYEGLYADAMPTADSERMVLNTLRLHSDALGDLRISVRDYAPHGTLRCEVGAQDASERVLLLRDGDGRYQRHNANLAPQDFFEALLQAIAPGKLAFQPGQGRAFRQWIKAHLQAPAQRRQVLEPASLRQADEPTTQALLQRPMFGSFCRLMQGLALSTEDRVRDLYPHMSREYVEAYVRNLDSTEGEQILSDLETEKRNLLQGLETWRDHPTLAAAHSQAAGDERVLRGHIIGLLIECWESRSRAALLSHGVRVQGELLSLGGLDLGRYLPSLGPLRGDFGHVSRLDLRGTHFNAQTLAFLDNFPNLYALDLSANSLEHVPASLTQMPRLALLDLEHNPITWSAEDYQRLAQCSQLRSLNLSRHPQLLSAPDLSPWPRLRRLQLRRTGISAWPAGLDSPRAHLPELDLTQTLVNSVPAVAEDSQAARIIARSWLTRHHLPADDEQRFVSYRRAAGLDPYRTVPVRGSTDSRYWLEGLSEETRATAQLIWNDLENEPGSEGFFNMIRLLQPEGFQTLEDHALFVRGRDDLRKRVWDVLIAADRDTGFRERVFSLAGAPINCADAGANTFNRIGVETLLETVLRDHSLEGLAQRENRLLGLARQTWRLERVKEIAREAIRHRTTPVSEGGLGQDYGSGADQVDDVEVYLAYQTGLKRRLDLPWLSEHMAYRTVAGVSAQQLKSAYTTVAEREAGAGLVNGLLEQPFWIEYLEQTHGPAFDARREQREQAASHVEDLRDAHEQWRSAEITPKRKAHLQQQITRLADALGVAPEEILAEHVLPDAMLKRLYENIQDRYNALPLKLTQEAVEKARFGPLPAWEDAAP